MARLIQGVGLPETAGGPRNTDLRNSVPVLAARVLQVRIPRSAGCLGQTNPLNQPRHQSPLRAALVGDFPLPGACSSSKQFFLDAILFT